MSAIPDVAGHTDIADRVLLYNAWEAEFKPLLGHTARWEGFCYIVRDQLARERPVIIETGTLRQPGNWEGDGQSTRIWDWLVRHANGFAVSVDVDPRAYQTARNLDLDVVIHQEDSVSFLRRQKHEPTLLYLDSYDYHPGQELNACMHQVAELAAIWERLPSGCLIASDDSHGPDHGKPALTRRLLHSIGIDPAVDSYIVVWRKP